MPVSGHALAEAETEPARAEQMQRVVGSAEFLAENMGKAPVLLVPVSAVAVMEPPGRRRT